MPNAVAEGLFLLALWAPPLTVVVCALSLLVTMSPAERSNAPAHAKPLTH